MINHLNIAFNNKIDDFTHKKFVRFGLGTYDREEFIIKVGSSIQIQAGFEYVDVFYNILSNMVTGDVTLKGTIVTTKDIKKELADLNIEPTKITGKKYVLDVTVSKDTFKKMVLSFNKYFMILNLTSDGISMAVKKSVPKPGNLQEKFTTLKISPKNLQMVIDEFLFDVKSEVKTFKKVNIKTVYEVKDIEIPKIIDKDPALAREKAIRKVEIKREIKIDDKEFKKSFERSI